MAKSKAQLHKLKKTASDYRDIGAGDLGSVPIQQGFEYVLAAAYKQRNTVSATTKRAIKRKSK